MNLCLRTPGRLLRRLVMRRCTAGADDAGGQRTKRNGAPTGPRNIDIETREQTLLRNDDPRDGSMPQAPTCKARRSDDKLYEYACANIR